MGQNKNSRRSQIEAQAARWLAQIEADEADFQAFEAWRDSNPAHAAAFAQIDAAWTRADRARALRPPGPADPDLFAPPESVTRRWWLQAAAAGGITLAGFGGSAFLLAGRVSAETGIGERRTIRLPDNSLLDLNTYSRASWRFTDTNRQVWLERGEAAFEVAHDLETRPFMLDAAGRSVALENGVFNARLRPDGAELVIVRGAAELGKGTSLAQGQAVRLMIDENEVRTLDPIVAVAAIAWRRGEIVFDGETLRDAVAEYNRYLIVPIKVTDPTILEIRLGGRFNTADPTQFLASIEGAFPIKVTQDGGKVTLSRRE